MAALRGSLLQMHISFATVHKCRFAATRYKGGGSTADRMSAENPDHTPDETTNAPLLVFLTSEICDTHFEMLSAYTQTHTLADFAKELEVAKAARALLRLVPDE
jgi:hypothetical protein